MSATAPLPGMFFRDQAMAMARTFPEVNIGISTWGQTDERLLLHAKDHVFNISKMVHARKLRATENQLSTNAVEYFSPALTFTRKILRGNIQSILKVNIINLRKFEFTFGKVDLIHAHCAYPAGYLAMMLKQKFRIPYIISEHMSPFPFPSFINKNGNISDFIRQPYAHANQVIAVGPALADHIARLNLGKPKVIFNPVDEDFFKPADASTTNKRFRFFTLGRLEHQKGIDVLLQSILKLIRTNSNFEFFIGGDGSQAETLKNLATSLRIQNHVNWLGELTREQCRKEFQQCDAFVLPSRHESQGIVYTEAMACGKPSIGTRCGGPEFLINSDNGIVVEPENVSELSEALLHMMSSCKNYSVETIREDFIRRFSFKAFAAQLLPVYEDVMRKGK